MSATAHDAVVLSLLALLAAAAAGPGNELSGALIDADVDFDNLPEDAPRGVLVQLLRARASYPYTIGGPRVWSLLLRVTCGARGDTMQVGQGRISSLMLAAVEAAIAGNASLGGLLSQPLQLDELAPDNGRTMSLPGVLDAVYSAQYQTGATTFA